jgi:hypothetical protein
MTIGKTTMVAIETLNNPFNLCSSDGVQPLDVISTSALATTEPNIAANATNEAATRLTKNNKTVAIVFHRLRNMISF